MSPSRGGGLPAESGSPQSQAIRAARIALRRLLSELRVTDALPERSRMLAVDATLPLHTVLSTVLSEQHPQPQIPPEANMLQGGVAPPNPAEGAGALRREGQGAAGELPQTLQCGVLSPALPSNVLAEVCEFEIPDNAAAPASLAAVEENADGESSARRQWLGEPSPDSMTMQDLEKMPMGTPVTVSELASFLANACETQPTEAPQAGDGSGGRWADRVGGEDASGAAPSAARQDDMLDWSLARWRAHCLQRSGGGKEVSGAEGEGVDRKPRLYQEDTPRYPCIGPVLMHQIPSSPPRPILSTDDPEASLLKAVELLLAYPELDALPIVSPVRCTVVAHLTLSYCLAYMLPRMRGADLLPLGGMSVGGPREGDPVLCKFDSTVFKAESWAQRTSEAPAAPMVLSQTQTVKELLEFFQKTHHSGVPVVEDNGSGGVLGLVTRRDLLDFLDLAMQSARRHDASQQAGGCAGDSVEFDLGAPVEAVLEALRRYRGPTTAEEASGTGAAFVREQELSLKVLPLRLLAAENRKLLFVQDVGAGLHPKLLRIISASDVWRLLLGNDQERSEAAAALAAIQVAEQLLAVSQDCAPRASGV